MSTARDMYDQRNRVGSAPFNEVNAMHHNAQTDDGQATDPDAARERAQNERNSAGFVPDGFYWSKDTSGKQLLKPTAASINNLAAELRAAYEDDERNEQLKVDNTLIRSLTNTIVRLKRKTKAATIMDLAQQLDNNEPVDFDKQLDGVLARLEKVEQGWMVNSLVRAVAQWAAQDAASNLRWCFIHQQQIHRHEDNGNEEAAGNSLLNFESSRTQLFVAMQIMAWAEEAGYTLDFHRAARDALGLAGWQSTQRLLDQQGTQNKRAVRSTTIDTLYGRLARQTPTPEEAAEDDFSDDNLPF